MIFRPQMGCIFEIKEGFCRLELPAHRSQPWELSVVRRFSFGVLGPPLVIPGLAFGVLAGIRLRLLPSCCAVGVGLRLLDEATLACSQCGRSCGRPPAAVLAIDACWCSEPDSVSFFLAAWSAGLGGALLVNALALCM